MMTNGECDRLWKQLTGNHCPACGDGGTLDKLCATCEERIRLHPDTAELSITMLREIIGRRIPQSGFMK